jgi:ketosteroid isomerase-like protein
MKKIILITTAFLLMISTGIIARAQGTEKKEAEKTTTVDAWRDALPMSEQPTNAPPVVIEDESKDNVESKESAAEIEKRILDLERRLMEAIKGRDAATLNHLLADDFILAGVNVAAGTQPDKTRFIDWALKKLELKSYAVEKVSARAYRTTTAIITVQYKRQANVAGSPSDGSFTATDVWVRRGKLWQLVSHHVSQSPK